jgi:hypothetical protein
MYTIKRGNKRDNKPRFKNKDGYQGDNKWGKACLKVKGITDM